MRRAQTAEAGAEASRAQVVDEGRYGPVEEAALVGGEAVAVGGEAGRGEVLTLVMGGCPRSRSSVSG